MAAALSFVDGLLIAFIGMDYAFGWETNAGFQRVFEDQGGKVVQRIWTPLNIQDYAPFLASLKKDIKRRYPAWFEFHPFGEVLPYAHNRITVDESRTDRYDVPLLKIDYRIGDNEKKMAAEQRYTIDWDSPAERDLNAALSGETVS